mgnify:FL=1
MPRTTASKLAELLKDFVAHATKYATGDKSFGGVTLADIEAMQTAFTAKWDAKVEADRDAQIAGAELDTAVQEDWEQLIRYRLGVQAEMGRDSESASTLPRMTQRRRASSSGPKGPEDP